MSLYRDRGVVLRTTRLGEADRIISLVTASHGKVRAVAKGVRRTKSRFGARLEPMSHVSMLCWQGRELDVVTQVEVIDSFRAVREDLARVASAAVMLEAVDQVAQERHAGSDLYTMLVGALRVLEEGDRALIVPAFLLKLLALDGAAPVFTHCVRCGTSGPLVAFDPGPGGALCAACRRGYPLSEPARMLASEILGGGLGPALAEPPGEAADEVSTLAVAAAEHHLERRLRSLRGISRLARSQPT